MRRRFHRPLVWTLILTLFSTQALGQAAMPVSLDVAAQKSEWQNFLDGKMTAFDYVRARQQSTQREWLDLAKQPFNSSPDDRLALRFLRAYSELLQLSKFLIYKQTPRDANDKSAPLTAKDFGLPSPKSYDSLSTNLLGKTFNDRVSAISSSLSDLSTINYNTLVMMLLEVYKNSPDQRTLLDTIFFTTGAYKAAQIDAYAGNEASKLENPLEVFFVRPVLDIGLTVWFAISVVSFGSRVYSLLRWSRATRLAEQAAATAANDAKDTLQALGPEDEASAAQKATDGSANVSAPPSNGVLVTTQPPAGPSWNQDVSWSKDNVQWRYIRDSSFGRTWQGIKNGFYLRPREILAKLNTTKGKVAVSLVTGYSYSLVQAMLHDLSLKPLDPVWTMYLAQLSVVCDFQFQIQDFQQQVQSFSDQFDTKKQQNRLAQIMGLQSNLLVEAVSYKTFFQDHLGNPVFGTDGHLFIDDALKTNRQTQLVAQRIQNEKGAMISQVLKNLVSPDGRTCEGKAISVDYVFNVLSETGQMLTDLDTQVASLKSAAEAAKKLKPVPNSAVPGKTNTAPAPVPATASPLAPTAPATAQPLAPAPFPPVPMVPDPVPPPRSP